MNPVSTHQLRGGLRLAGSWASRILPGKTSIEVERWLRGYEEFHRLAACDAAVVSFGKSGRTWLRVMLSRYFARLYGMPLDALMEFDEFHRRNIDCPVIFFTHDNYLKDYTRTDDKMQNYRRCKVILLLRDPRDTAVSQYFQWKSRMQARKKIINRYPEGDMDIFNFISDETAGMPKIIRFMNAWAKSLKHHGNVHVVRYEDLRKNTETELSKLLVFIGLRPDKPALEDCVAYASIENMRRIERENAERGGASTRLKPGNADDPTSFKVRRAKVGGWQDYLTEPQTDEINGVMAKSLLPDFGYAV